MPAAPPDPPTGGTNQCPPDRSLRHLTRSATIDARRPTRPLGHEGLDPIAQEARRLHQEPEAEAAPLIGALTRPHSPRRLSLLEHLMASTNVTDAELDLLRRRAVRRRRPSPGPLVEAMQPQVQIAVRRAGRLSIERDEARSEAVICLLEHVERWQHLDADSFRAVATKAMRRAVQRADRAARGVRRVRDVQVVEVLLEHAPEVADDDAVRALEAVEVEGLADSVLSCLETRQALLLACRAWGLAHPDQRLTLAELGTILRIGDRDAAARHLAKARAEAAAALAA